MDTAHVGMRILVAAVPLRAHGFLEPRDRLIRLSELNKVHPDIVVRIAIIRIDSNRLLAFRNRFIDAAKMTERPP